MLPGVKGIKNSRGSEWKPLEQIPGTIFPNTLRQLESGQQYLFCSLPDADRGLETTERI